MEISRLYRLWLAFLLASLALGKAQAFTSSANAPTRSKSRNVSLQATRSQVLHKCGFWLVATHLVLPLSSAHADLYIPPQKSYSTNGRNMDRLNAGDASGGSVYDNNPSSPAARRRRAMQGCKIPSARTKAAQISSLKNLSEKDCNAQVIQQSPDTMLQAMQELQCPTCPYGVQP